MKRVKKISDVMQVSPYQATPDMALPELVEELVRRRINGCPVQDEQGLLVGEISLSDVAVAMTFPPKGIPNPKVGDVMVREVITLDQAAELSTAIRLLQKHRIHRLVITYHGRAVGILTPFDLMVESVSKKVELLI